MLDLGAIEGEEVLEWRSALARTLLVHRAALVMKNLLEPKTGGGAVEQTEQAEVIFLGRARRELDDRRRLLEDLAAPVEDEVVVGGDVGEGDRQRNSELRGGQPAKLPLRPASVFVC